MENQNRNLSWQEFLIETHYGVQGNALNYNTRKVCFESEIIILQTILQKFYPILEIEILCLPAENGSFKEIKKIILKGELEKTPIAISFTALSLLLAIYSTFIQSPKMHPLEQAEICKKLLNDNSLDLSNALIELCKDVGVKKTKNNRTEALIQNTLIEYEETIIKLPDVKIIYNKRVNRTDFHRQIEYIPENIEFLKENITAHIELAQPYLLKQTQKGKGKTWSGIYYGNDIIDENGNNVISDGEIIKFYMQDKEYKSRMYSHQIQFETGDNIKIILDISAKFDPFYRTYKFKRVNIKEVSAHNDNLIPHKIKLERKKNIITNQPNLFIEEDG